MIHEVALISTNSASILGGIEGISSCKKSTIQDGILIGGYYCKNPTTEDQLYTY
jgi:hypothetical protein